MEAQEHFLAIPRESSGRGVLVLHSWWGLNAFFRDLCKRLASHGFVALAPDLYQGEGVATTIADAERLRKRATARRKEPVYKLLIREIEYLAAHEDISAPKIAVLGCSMGGHWAFWLSQRPELPIAGTVTFYAARSGDFTQTESAFLCHFAENDKWVSAAAKRKLINALQTSGVSATFHTYPGTGHWFFERDREEAFQAKAARTAWQRTLEFFGATV
ncbi:MAG: dienelactone hydrolase family protein [Gammaproteobacteria bacterium]|nr:dienelactone hydrolase family protein [Gammaproteobacteria bacterium]